VVASLVLHSFEVEVLVEVGPVNVPLQAVLNDPPLEVGALGYNPRGEVRVIVVLGVQITELVGLVEVLLQPVVFAPGGLIVEHGNHLLVAGVFEGVGASQVELPAPPHVVPVVYSLQGVLRFGYVRLREVRRAREKSGRLDVESQA